MGRDFAMLIVAEADRVGSLLRAVAEYVDPIDERLARLAARPPDPVADFTGPDCRRRHIHLGYFWLLTPEVSPGFEGYFLDTAGAPLKEIRGVLHLGGWLGDIHLHLGCRHLLLEFATQRGLSGIEDEEYLQAQFRRLLRDGGGLALLLDREDRMMHRYDDIRVPAVRRLVRWPERMHPNADTAVAALLGRLSGDA